MSLVLQVTICILCSLAMTVNGFFPSNRKGGVTCPDPIIENGKHDSMESAWFIWTHPVFKVLNFACDDGYMLEGPKSARCQTDGTWTGLPKCVSPPGVKLVKSICNIPSIGDSVEVYPKLPAYDFGQQVTFVCPGVRKADSIFTTYCGADGQFNPSPPKCIEPRCVPPAVPRFGGVRSSQPSYAVGEVAYFKCAQGFRLVGEQNVTCGKDGYFPYADTKCEAMLLQSTTCDKPVKKPNQFIYQDKDTYEVGEAITFFCEQGFLLKGTRTIKCLPTRLWSQAVPNCNPIRKGYCMPPANPQNGFLLTIWRTRYPVGSIAAFSCRRGFVLRGTNVITCTDSGFFSSSPPTCSPQYVYKI